MPLCFNSTMSYDPITPRATTAAAASCPTNDCDFNILQLSPEVLAIIFSKSFDKSSLDQLLKLSTVCRTFRHLIINDWFLQKYYFSFFHKLNIWCQFSNESTTSGDSDDFLHNSVKNIIDEEKTLINKSIPPEIETNGFFNHGPCLTFSDSCTHIEKCYELNADNFSFSFWFLSRATHFDLPLMHIVFENEQSRLSLRFRVHDNQLQFWIPCTPRWITLGQWQINEWHHIAVVFVSLETPQTIKIYLNSNKNVLKIRTCSYVHVGPFRSLKVAIGYVNGSFADFAVWSTILLPIEIRSIFHQKTTINKVNVAKYIFDNW
ncbi:unnamed protein product, partial [Didymodactylos carnosus]